MNRKFLHFALFIILLFGLVTFFYLCYNKISNTMIYTSSTSNFIEQTPQTYDENSQHIFSIAFISDSHSNSSIFEPLRVSLKKFDASLLVHAGDLTDFGSLEDLKSARSDLDSLQVSYLVLPGDHDIAATSSVDNFNKFFSIPESFITKDFNVLFVPNFYNFKPFESNTFDEIVSKIDSADIIISSQPIYVNEDNIFFKKFMGSFEAFDNLSFTQRQNLQVYKKQRDIILDKIRQSRKPKVVISGDHHRSSTFIDPVNEKVSYHILGSLSKYIYFGNTKLLQTSLQSNRFSILKISKPINGANLEFNIQEVEIK